MSDRADRVLDLVRRDPQAMHILRTVRGLDLRDWAIGAGFVRNRVWDQLSGLTTATPPNDIDVLYHDVRDLSPTCDDALEARLNRIAPGIPWSVRNQARMHLKNGDPPYASTEHAIGFWIEVPTCIAVTLDEADELTLTAPHGLDDLFAMVVRPTPRGRERIEVYRQRMKTKNWPALWPRLRMET